MKTNKKVIIITGGNSGLGKATAEILASQNQVVILGRNVKEVEKTSKELKCDLSASTGIHNYESCIKMIMAGASTVQLCSVLYQKGMDVIPEFLSSMEKWMKEKGYKSINEFKGSIHKNLDKNIFSRMQYIKMYSGLDQ